MKPLRKNYLMLLFFCVFMPLNYALENNQSHPENGVKIASTNKIEQDLPFLQKSILLFKEWAKKFMLNYNKENLQSIREELNEIYKQLGDSFKQAHNTRQLAQELPALTDKIGKNLEALNLYTQAHSSQNNDPVAIQNAVKETAHDLISLKNELSDTMVDTTIKATIDAKVNDALYKVGLTTDR